MLRKSICALILLAVIAVVPSFVLASDTEASSGTTPEPTASLIPAPKPTPTPSPVIVYVFVTPTPSPSPTKTPVPTHTLSPRPTPTPRSPYQDEIDIVMHLINSKLTIYQADSILLNDYNLKYATDNAGGSALGRALGIYAYDNPNKKQALEKVTSIVKNAATNQATNIVGSYYFNFEPDAKCYSAFENVFCQTYGEYKDEKNAIGQQERVWECDGMKIIVRGTVGSGSYKRNATLNQIEKGKATFVIDVNSPHDTGILNHESFSIRNGIRFGMSRDEVESLEKGIGIDIGNGTISYATTASNFDCMLYYLFNSSDQLYGIFYSFSEEHSADNLYIDDYNELQKSLENKYGAAASNEKNWKRDLYKNDPDEYGFAVSLGDLEYKATWFIADEAFIEHKLSGDNFEITHSLGYVSMEYDHDVIDMLESDGI